ncbi:ATP-binding cassette domain-containing protein [Candidatus Woesearchaeota archaeon]|nr:ATP-binding cassette domain-containing protein [Candidatus Woesearchaeota archaeon]MBT7062453.1 ATP-binding cassette domain-containing protein [Candidatus Woesearchaeota archaeon]MBT7402968.1 ATP-binding cassette domain-containing protein [Candidatus Woesearchaeota archaeon]
MARDSRKEEKIGNKYSFRRQFQDLWFYAEGQRNKLVVYFILTIIISLIAMAPPYFYGRIIDDLTNNTFGNIFLFLGLIALSHIIYETVYNFVIYKTKIIGGIVRNQSRLKTFNHLFGLDYSFYETHPLGQIFSRIQTGSSSVRLFIKLLFKTTIVKLSGMIFSVAILFTLNWVVALAALSVLMLFLIHGIYTMSKLVELENKVYRVSENVYSTVYDFFSHIKIIKLLNIKDKLLKTLSSSYEDIINKQKITRRYERGRSAVSKLISQLSSVAILTYLAINVMDSLMTIGMAVMIYGFYSKFSSYASTILGDYTTLIGQRTGMYRMSLIYENVPKITEPKSPKRPENWQKIKFNNLFFNYPSKKVDVLKGINITINKGEKVAIVGLSGCGKSTLAKLFMRLYQPKQGSICIGDVDIKDIHSNDLYELIKIVPQDNELMNSSIYDNMQLATNKKVSKDDIVNALKNSASWEFVNKLPEKLNTVVGPDGVKISGGEKQRLCIARALLSKPKIIVLDEATSNLDVVTEKKVHKDLHNLSKNITLIAITHRISSVYLFDRIIVMHDGKVVGEGTHRQLLKSNKYYKKLQEASKKDKTKKLK